MSPLLIASALFALAAYLYAARVAWLDAADGPAALPVAVLALALHLGALAAGFQVADGRLGLTLALSLLTWTTAIILTLLWPVRPLQPLRASLYALAAFGALCGLLPDHAGAEAPHSWKIVLHAALSIFAAGLLTLAAAQAIALSVLNRLLHRPEDLARALKLPPLQSSENWLFQLIGAGFFVLSLALLSGLIFVDDLFAQHLAHKTIISLLAWAIFAALLLGKWRWGWRGARAIRWALSGYGLLLLAYFGSKLVLEQILGRHWS